MAKLPKKNTKNEPISISQIYETIKGRNFLQDLWWDLISDIKEKPTYKRIRTMVDSLLSDTLSSFATAPMDNDEQLKRRTALTEISIMTYTVDTVISEVLYRKLQNEFQSMITNIVEEIQSEKRNKEIILQSSLKLTKLENIESIFEEEVDNKEGIVKHKDSNGNQEPKNTDQDRVNRMVQSTPLKRGRPPKKRPLEVMESSASSDKTGESTPLPENHNRSSKSGLINQTSTLKQTINAIVKEKKTENGNESDCDSISSRISNVSSVHTSELSSFEDTISIESGDEGRGKRKKQIPLKIVNDMYIQGKLSEIYHIGENGSKKRKQISLDSPNTKKEVKSNISPRKQLPQRIRKPNSKYNTDTMYCQVKDYSRSFSKDSTLSSSDEEIDIMTVEPEKEQRKSEVSNNGIPHSTPKSHKEKLSVKSLTRSPKK